MLTRETLARKAKHIISHVEDSSTLEVDGVTYKGITESNSYATNYRDNGWLEGTLKTWIGVQTSLKFIPETGMDVLCDKVKMQIMGVSNDPLQNIIRIDLGDSVGEATL